LTLSFLIRKDFEGNRFQSPLATVVDILMTVHSDDEYKDIHEILVPYDDALLFFEELERNNDVKAYCNGSNISGRWIFQIYNLEFIHQLAEIINSTLIATHNQKPVAEVMAGDGRLTEFLQPLINHHIIATDAKDGRYNIAYPKWVETCDALETVEKYSPSLIILSWEPYLSMTGAELIRTRVPMIWIGNPKMCGHPDIFQQHHLSLNCKFALSRHDSFLKREFKTDIFLFNIEEDWLSQTE
jgi:hypothetical protein